MAVVAEIRQLVVPLRDYPQRVLNECDHDQKAADGGEVPTVAVLVARAP
jgi:hypothetical protein